MLKAQQLAQGMEAASKQTIELKGGSKSQEVKCITVATIVDIQSDPAIDVGMQSIEEMIYTKNQDTERAQTESICSRCQARIYRRTVTCRETRGMVICS